MVERKGDVFERRLGLLETMIDRRKRATYRAFGLTPEGEPDQALYGYQKVGPQAALDWWQGYVADPKVSEQDKALKFMSLPEETQTAIKSTWAKKGNPPSTPANDQNGIMGRG